MMRLRTLYLRNLLKDLKDHWIVILVFVFICGAALAAYGYKTAKAGADAAEKQWKEFHTYEDRLIEYNRALDDIRAAIDWNTESINNLQTYIDSSIFMQIDPNDVKGASVYYVIRQNEGTIVSAVQQSIASYINNGGLLSDLGDQYQDLHPEAWNEIIKVDSASNVLTITVIHYDAESAEKILDAVCKALTAHLEVLVKKQGGFELKGGEVSTFTRQDSSVAADQNSVRNSLRTYTASRADYEAKLVTQGTARDAYIETYAIDMPVSPGPRRTAAIYGLFGLISGGVITAAILLLRYIFSDKIRRKEELDSASLTLLSSAARGKLSPDERRIAAELRARLASDELKGVFLQDLTGDEKSALAESLAEAFKEAEIPCETGREEGDSAEELEKMLALGSCVLLLESGRTGFRQIEKQVNLCKRFGIRLYGCILNE
ncbi:MAG: hypothetical protein IKR59_03925 [Lachnospiraceae bacterium]|nr:hypothetical protein [Lachnospiraceae bacterium]